MLLISALQDLKDPCTQATNIKSILLRTSVGLDLDLKNEFLAKNPLKTAIAHGTLEAAKALLEDGLTIDNWKDLVDEDTPMYTLLDSKLKKTAAPKPR